MDLAPFVRVVPDFPSPGILFRDITPLLLNAEAFADTLARLASAAEDSSADVIVGIESRGFLFGAPVAVALKMPFVPVRKPGKLPAAHMSVEYALEYGESQLDIHQDALTRGQRAFIVDDLLATGGTARAAARLVELLGAQVAGFGFVVELRALNGRAALAEYRVSSLLSFDA